MMIKSIEIQGMKEKSMMNMKKGKNIENNIPEKMKKDMNIQEEIMVKMTEEMIGNRIELIKKSNAYEHY